MSGREETLIGSNVKRSGFILCSSFTSLSLSLSLFPSPFSFASSLSGDTEEEEEEEEKELGEESPSAPNAIPALRSIILNAHSTTSLCSLLSASELASSKRDHVSQERICARLTVCQDQVLFPPLAGTGTGEAWEGEGDGEGEAVNHVRNEVRKSIARGSEGRSCGIDACARWSDNLRFFPPPTPNSGRGGIRVDACSVSVSKGVESDDDKEEEVRRAEAAAKNVFVFFESSEVRGVDVDEEEEEEVEGCSPMCRMRLKDTKICASGARSIFAGRRLSLSTRCQ